MFVSNGIKTNYRVPILPFDTMNIHNLIVEERYFSEDVKSLKEYDEGFKKAYDNGETYGLTIKLSDLFLICPRKEQKKLLYKRFVAFLSEKGIELSIQSRKKQKTQRS